jgi:hypothetical protein
MRYFAALLSLLLMVTVIFSSAIRAAQPVTTNRAGSEAAPASKVVEKEGLAVTVTMGKAVFAADEQPKFTVQLKNVSKEPLSLFDADYFWNWTMEFTKTAKEATQRGPWRARMTAIDQVRAMPKTQVLAPGEVLEVSVDLAKGDPFEYSYAGIMKDLIRPVARLEPGKYQLVIGISLKENTTLGGNGRAKHWMGEITTEPLDLEITGLGRQAQQALDELNGKMANESWAMEADFYERPGEYPKNRASSGEGPAYLQAAKARLAGLGVQMRWNAGTKTYEVVDVVATKK